MCDRHVIVLTVLFIPLAVALLVLHEAILLAIGDFLMVQDDLHPADVIHVIAGDDYRTDYAIHLYKQGYAKRIFFTGGWCVFHRYWHGQHAMERAQAQGVPAPAIAVDESPVSSTYSEALRLKEFAAQSEVPIYSVIVVSDAYHMRRARWTYRQVLGNQVDLQMAPVPFELTPYQRRWWTDEPSRKYVKEEYMKLLYYYARYGVGWQPLANWLASFDVD